METIYNLISYPKILDSVEKKSFHKIIMCQLHLIKKQITIFLLLISDKQKALESSIKSEFYYSREIRYYCTLLSTDYLKKIYFN